MIFSYNSPSTTPPTPEFTKSSRGDHVDLTKSPDSPSSISLFLWPFPLLSPPSPADLGNGISLLAISTAVTMSNRISPALSSGFLIINYIKLTFHFLHLSFLYNHYSPILSSTIIHPFSIIFGNFPHNFESRRKKSGTICLCFNMKPIAFCLSLSL